MRWMVRVELRVLGLVRGFEIVVVALRHHFVLQQKLGAIELEIGARDFNLGLLVIGARLGNLAALNAGRWSRPFSLPGPAERTVRPAAR